MNDFRSIDINYIIENKNSLSASRYSKIFMKNDFKFKLDRFFSENLSAKFLGHEVGSLNYIKKSPNIVLKTKGLTKEGFLPILNDECFEYVNPKSFRKYDLKKGDLILSKDSNIGETVILDRDYPNMMLSGALYKLPVKSYWKYYVLAFTKHEIFRNQLDLMVPKGATIRHANTLFLDCEIPVPKKNTLEVIKLVSAISKLIVVGETIIKAKYNQIQNIIINELKLNQRLENTFDYSLPTYNEILTTGRLDTSRYTEKFKQFKFKITNYKYGYKNLSQMGFNFSRGQNLQVSAIGKSFYSEKKVNNFYELIVSSNINEMSLLEKVKYLGNGKSLKTINEGDIIYSCRGAQFGRVMYFDSKHEKSITNIDNMQISNPAAPEELKIFIVCFLNLLRTNKHIYNIAITGSGANSLTKYQIDEIIFPQFPQEKLLEIKDIFKKNVVGKNPNNLTDFIKFEKIKMQDMGMSDLHERVKYLKKYLNVVLDKIVLDKNIEIDYSKI